MDYIWAASFLHTLQRLFLLQYVEVVAELHAPHALVLDDLVEVDEVAVPDGLELRDVDGVGGGRVDAVRPHAGHERVRGGPIPAPLARQGLRVEAEWKAVKLLRDDVNIP